MYAAPMRNALAAIAMAGLTTAASAELASSRLGDDGSSNAQPGLPAAGSTNGWTVDISGFNSVDSAGSPLNDSIDLFIGQGWLLYAIEWDVTIATVGASWLSEVTFGFTELDGQPSFAPGAGDDTPGTASYSSGGVLDLADIGIEPFRIDADGVLSIEIFESFDDVEGSLDASFLQGSRMTFYFVPSPASLGVLGAGAIALGRRRR